MRKIWVSVCAFLAMVFCMGGLVGCSPENVSDSTGGEANSEGNIDESDSSSSVIQPEEDEGQLEFVLSNDESHYILKGMGNYTDSVLRIPETYKGLPVSEVAAEFVGYMEQYTFTAIEVPASVTFFGRSAFFNICTEAVYYNGTLSQWCNITFEDNGFANPMTNGADLYISGEKVVDLVIPEDVTEIKGGSFFYCSSINSLTIGDHVTKLGDSCFGRSSVQTVSIGNSVAEIPAYAFGESGVRDLQFSNSVKKVGNDAFANVFGMEKIDYKGSLADWLSIDFSDLKGEYAVYNGSMATLYINGEPITDLVIEEVDEIGPYAFAMVGNLNSITVGGSVKRIGEHAFKPWENLKSVRIEGDVEEIGESAVVFSSAYGKTKLGSLYIGGSIEKIAKGAFGFYKVEDLTIADGVTGGSANMFIGDVYRDWEIPQATVPANAISWVKNDELKRLTVSSGDIAEEALKAQKSLMHVTLGDNVYSIGKNAFENCTNLLSIELGEKLADIEQNSFKNCYRLIEVYNRSSLNVAGETNGEFGNISLHARQICSTQEGRGEFSQDEDGFMLYSQGEERYLVNYYHERYDVEYLELKVPEKVTIINDYAFFDEGYYHVTAKEIRSVEISNGVKEIGEGAFYGCRYLQAVNIPNSVKSIAADTFNTCYSLQTIHIPESVKSIGANAFKYSGLTEIEIPESITEIEWGAFAYTHLLSVIIPDTVVTIGQDAFEHCGYLMHVTIGASVTEIGGWAFAFCPKLVEVYNRTNRLIDMYIFGSSLGNASLSSHLDTVPKHIYTVGGNSRLSALGGEYIVYTSGSEVDLLHYLGTQKELILYSNITQIHRQAFYENQELTGVYMGDKVKTVGEYAFYGCKNLTSVSLSNSLQTIDYGAFSYCEKLENIELPSSVESIGRNAFGSTAYYYQEENWKDGILYANGWVLDAKDSISGLCLLELHTKGIAEGAFMNCKELEAISLYSPISVIPVSAFEKCISLKEIILPEDLKRIEARAFFGCESLSSIVIPKSVTKLDSGAFAGGCNSLQNVYYEGTQAQWKAIDYGVLNGGYDYNVHWENGWDGYVFTDGYENEHYATVHYGYNG